MGKALSLAWAEKGRKPRRKVQSDSGLLLAGSGPRLPEGPSSRRNKRKETAITSKKSKSRTAEDSPPEGKISAEAEDLDGGSPRRKGHKRSNKDRQPDRGAEGADRTPRRSASELGLMDEKPEQLVRSASDLGIEWIGSHCPDGQPHHLIGIHNLDGGCLFKCTGCKKHQWLPTIMTEAANLDRMIDHFGAEAGYHKFLDKHREAKMMVAKLQNLWYARQRMGDDGEFMKLVVAVMEDKEYDKKEDI